MMKIFKAVSGRRIAESVRNGGYMRKILIVINVIIVLLIFQGCSTETSYWQNWEAPNWTSDGKIVFLEDDGEQKINSWGDMVGGNQTITLYEIDQDGNNLQEIGEIISCSFESGRVLVPMSTSSAGDWVVLSMEDWRRGDHYPVVYTIKRNGDSLSEIGSGKYPDFSPDASQVVYEKPDEGIWIMDRDGGNDHQIISDTEARYPVWSADSHRIAIVHGNLYIINTSGDFLDTLGIRTRGNPPDWGPLDSNAICISTGFRGSIVYIETGQVDTLENMIVGDAPIKWSPLGSKFIGYDEEGYFIIERNGSNRWYLEP